MNSVNYKNAFTCWFLLKDSHMNVYHESAIKWLETQSCHWFLDCFSVTKQIIKSCPIKWNKVLYCPMFSEHNSSYKRISKITKQHKSWQNEVHSVTLSHWVFHMISLRFVVVLRLAIKKTSFLVYWTFLAQVILPSSDKK